MCLKSSMKKLYCTVQMIISISGHKVAHLTSVSDPMDEVGIFDFSSSVSHQYK